MRRPAKRISPSKACKPGERLGERRLAGAGLADDAEDLARRDVEADVARAGELRVGAAEQAAEEGPAP